MPAAAVSYRVKLVCLPEPGVDDVTLDPFIATVEALEDDTLRLILPNLVLTFGGVPEQVLDGLADLVFARPAEPPRACLPPGEIAATG